MLDKITRVKLFMIERDYYIIQYTETLLYYIVYPYQFDRPRCKLNMLPLNIQCGGVKWFTHLAHNQETVGFDSLPPHPFNDDKTEAWAYQSK